MEYKATAEIFSEFINDQSLTREQIVFVKKVIEYIAKNGYIENVSEQLRPPFDKPTSFIKLFTGEKQKRIVELVNKVRDNASTVFSC